MSNNKNIRSLFNSRYTKIGGFSALVCAVVIAIAILLNVLVNSLPATYTKFDTSSAGLYSFSDVTRDLVSDLQDDITVYLLAEAGNEDPVVEGLVERYVALSSHLKMKKIDPAVQPTFASVYTSETLSSNSLIVVNEDNGHSLCVDYSKIYLVTYSDEEIYNYYLYGITPTGSRSFDGENALSSAIDYVTATKLPTIRFLTGNGETALGESLKKSLSDDNYVTADLSLVTEGAVPSDTDILVINAPTYDLTEEEIAALRSYIANGGNVVLTTGYNTGDLPRLFAFTQENGLRHVSGLLLEGSASNYYSQRPYYCIPKVTSNDFSSRLSGSSVYLLMTNAHAILAETELPENIKVSTLLSSTDAAYVKTEITENSSILKEDGDLTGSFLYGAMAEVTGESGSAGRLIWFSSDEFLSDYLNSFANQNYFLGVTTSLCGKGTSLSIASKSMQVQALIVNESSANLWSALLIFLVPGIILCGGLIIWYRRKKR